MSMLFGEPGCCRGSLGSGQTAGRHTGHCAITSEPAETLPQPSLATSSLHLPRPLTFFSASIRPWNHSMLWHFPGHHPAYEVWLEEADTMHIAELSIGTWMPSHSWQPSLPTWRSKQHLPPGAHQQGEISPHSHFSAFCKKQEQGLQHVVVLTEGLTPFFPLQKNSRQTKCCTQQPCPWWHSRVLSKPLWAPPDFHFSMFIFHFSLFFFLCKLINTLQKAGMNFEVCLPLQNKFVSLLKTRNYVPYFTQQEEESFYHLWNP